MKLDGNDFKGFVIGVTASIIAIIIWDYYKHKLKILEHSEQQLKNEVKSAVLELKKHISETNGKTIS